MDAVWLVVNFIFVVKINVFITIRESSRIFVDTFGTGMFYDF